MLESQDRVGNKTDEAQLRYLRAADSAQQGLYVEAESEFIAALNIDPSLHTARFQLGLLQLTSGKPDQARSTWVELHGNEAPPDLQYFVRGFEALICDDFNASIELLRSGIAINQSNPALNKDMNMVIAKIQATIGTQNTPPIIPVAADAPDANVIRTDFSLYGDKG